MCRTPPRRSGSCALNHSTNSNPPQPGRRGQAPTVFFSPCSLLLTTWLSGCSGWSPARSLSARLSVGVLSEQGSASWYGPGFHGNRTANGEVYDMHKLTAAHRTFAAGVGGGSAISEHRPAGDRADQRSGARLREGRILDLSLAGAQAMGWSGAAPRRSNSG
ncbi:MAG: hypothetical protein IPL14_17760 [Nitrospira sp.]|nr:hypothetical protein [Nitrospira sp.]